MLTARGWWLVLMALGLTALGGVQAVHGHSLALIGLTLLLWAIGQWLMFAARTHRLTSYLILERELRDERGPVETLWSHRSFEVRLRIRLRGWLSLPYVVLTDRLPATIDAADGSAEWQGELLAARPAEIRYRIDCGAAGRVRFEGVKVQVTDLQGLFFRAMFVAAPREVRVLPPLVDAGGHWPTTKRHNLLPPPGTHRHRRPGSGAELLDLRDYLPGDPPKMIAWKVSARRDRLITKEFESEVPVRCTLFVDTSNSVRLGPPGRNALSRQVEVAAAVAQATVAARDQVGLCLFDEEMATAIQPARTPRHLTHVLNLLADAAGQAPTQGRASVDALLPAAYAFAQEVYPHLLRDEINSFPWWLPWLSPTPRYTFRHPRRLDYLYSRLPLLLPLYLMVGGAALAGALATCAWLYIAIFDQSLLPRMFTWLGLFILVLTAVCLIFGFALAPGRLFFPKRRRHYRWRKQLAAILSARYDLAPGGVALLAEDHELFAVSLQRFLGEHQVPYTLPLYDGAGRYLFAAPGKIDVLAKALLNAVAHSHDNELFVLLVDLLELRDELAPLLRAVKVASARHHRVMIVCPWPPGVPPPAKKEPEGLARGDRPLPLADLLNQATTLRFHDSFYRLRRAFARARVPVLCAQDHDAAPLIVERLDRLRQSKV